MRIFNIVTQKGGTGKSETVKNLAYGLSQKGLRTLVVDLDPQANTTTTLLKLNKQVTPSTLKEMEEEFNNVAACGELTGKEGIDIINKYMLKKVDGLDVSDVLINPSKMKEAIVSTVYEKLDILPSSSKLIETDMKLKSDCMRSDTRLMIALNEVEKDYDVCIIDNSPFINAITINGITACKNEGDLIIVPIKLENGSLEGVDTTLQQMLEILKFSSFLGFDFKLLFTMRNRTKIEAAVEETMRFLFPGRCFEQTIRYQAKPVTQSSFEKKILISHSNSNVANDYRALVEEIYNTIDKTNIN